MLIFNIKYLVEHKKISLQLIIKRQVSNFILLNMIMQKNKNMIRFINFYSVFPITKY